MDVNQAKAFEADVCTPKAILYFEATDEILKERILKRNNFDDTEKAIDNRLETFNKVSGTSLPLSLGYLITLSLLSP